MDPAGRARCRRAGAGRRLVGGSDRISAHSPRLVPGGPGRYRDSLPGLRRRAAGPRAGGRGRGRDGVRQLARDDEVAAREGLSIRTVLGDMRDLSAFADASFDVVFNPVSNVFCPDVLPVWQESFRVLRPGGVLMAGFLNPDIFIFDVAALDEREEFIVRHRLPFSTLDMSDADRARAYGDGAIEYSHSLTEQIGGQLATGFLLTHLVEAPHHADATARYMPGYIATRARKP